MSDEKLLLNDADRVVLAVTGLRGPVLAPMAAWWDGAHLWMSTPADSVKVRLLRRDPRCALWLWPAEEGAPGAAVSGSARVYGIGEPLALALHGPALSGAVAALASRNVDRIVGYAQDAARVPSRFRPRNRVVVRVAVESIRGVDPPPVGPGIAPALPGEVPPPVRRTLAGQRRVTLGVVNGDELRLTPAVLGAGYALDAADPVPVGARLAAALDHEPGRRPTKVTGLVLHGEATAAPGSPQPRLAVDRVTWWRGFELDGAEVAPAGAPTIELPD